MRAAPPPIWRRVVKTGEFPGLELLREWNEPSKSWTERGRLWARVYRLT